MDRVPFALAISDDDLLGKAWKRLSLPQQTILKALYGLPLKTERELVVWSGLQGAGLYDDLGYLTGVSRMVPYEPKEYDILTGVIGRQSGKALALDTPIPTPTGWSTMGELRPGDAVIGEDGQPTRVAWTTGVMEGHATYRLTFSDGTSIVADADHQWKVWSKAARKAITEPYRKAKATVLTTQQMVDSGVHTTHKTPEVQWAIELPAAVELPEQPLPIDPYLLGLWLGDGAAEGASVTTADAEIVAAFEAQGWTLTPKGRYGYSITDAAHRYSQTESFCAKLRTLGLLKNKHIPAAYLRGSIAQRIAIVQGLLDSDGYAAGFVKGAEFCNTNERLILGLREILASLGVRSTLRGKIATLYGVQHKYVWTVAFKAPFPAFRLSRKLSAYQPVNADTPRFHYITAIEAVPSVPVKCIGVEAASHMFLAGTSFIPTHNSTEVTALAGAYEITLGGHAQRANGVEIKFAFVAHDKSLAQTNMQGITRVVLSSPLLSNEFLDPKDVGTEHVTFKNGIVMEAMTNTIKGGRGYGIMGVVMDELGFWYKDATSANPDKEVETTLSYSMQRFDHPKQFRITTPWTKEGLAYEAFLAGTEGRNYRNQPDVDGELIDNMDGHLVVYAPTAAMEVPEPLVTRKKLARARKRDPVKFTRESLAQFIDAAAGFLSHTAIHEAVERGRTITPGVIIPSADYIAVMDPAFRRDEYALTVGHKDKTLGIVQDYVFAWVPPPGERLRPSDILDKVKVILDRYGISVVYSDQAQLESLQELALDRDFMVHGFDMTKVSKPKVMQTLNLKLNQGQIVLKDDMAQTQQLKDLVRTVTDGSYTKIAAPPGKFDDRAMCLALMTYITDQQPSVEAKDVEQAMAPVNRREKSERLVDVAARVRARLATSDDPEADSILGYSEYLMAVNGMTEDSA